MHLDRKIRREVQILRAGGIETFESCQGGRGHSYPEPTIRFHGDRSEGLRAMAVAQRSGLKVAYLRRIWAIEDGELVGPWWEMVFTPTKTMARRHSPAASRRRQ